MLLQTEIRRPTRHKYGVIVFIDGQGLSMVEHAATFAKAYEDLIHALRCSAVVEYGIKSSTMVSTESGTIDRDGELISLFETEQTGVRWDFTVDVYGEFHRQNGVEGEWYGPVT